MACLSASIRFASGQFCKDSNGIYLIITDLSASTTSW
jgi:hypothetical protein